jgi:glyoxylate reductase
MKQRVLITEPILDEIIEKLTPHFDVTIGERGRYNNESNLMNDIVEYDAIISMLSNPVSAKVLSEGKRLKLVANYAVGVNNIDLEAAKNLRIHVTNTPGVLTEATADIVWSLILATVRRIPESELYLRADQFKGWEPLGFLGFDLPGKTLGIIGMGRIGQAVARRAMGFGLRLIYTNRKPVEASLENELKAEYVPDYRDLVKQSDIVSLNCPLSPENTHMINEELLKQMKSHSVIINAGRGPLIDEAALAKALHERWIGGAGLDVFEREPIVHPDLLTAPNAVLIPHIGSATKEARYQMGELAAHSMMHLLIDQADPHLLPNLVV